jgi:methyl-accepting chemotaxis protein
MSLTIKQKLSLLVGLIIVAFLALYGLQLYDIRAVEKVEQARLLNSDINIGMLTLRRHEKDFLARSDLKYAEKFDKVYVDLMAKLQQLKVYTQAKGIAEKHLVELEQDLNSYAVGFRKLVKLRQEIGLNEEQGLRGNLRNAVHEAEALMKQLDQDRLSKDMLMLRRREKDFMLREDLKHVKKFDHDLAVFHQDMEAATLPADTKANIRSKMNTYQSGFHAMVEGYKAKGLNQDDGLRGEMRNTIHRTEKSFAELETILREHLRHSSNSLIFVGLVVFLSLFALVVLVSFLIAKGILKPVKDLQTVMSEACDNKDLSLRAQVSGKDEIASMASTFNIMLAEFQELISRVLNAVQEVSVSSEQLSSITEQTAGGVMRQHRESDQVATAMNEMTATVQEVSHNASDAMAASRQTDDAAVNGKAIVNEVKDGIHAMAREIEGASTTIQHLQAQSDNIGDVLNVIRDIADQTNLLALNAAIEAARAGEQGRGFAVVADEVRTLANRTQESTSEIQTMIERLQTAARNAVTSMESGQSLTLSNVKQADKAGLALDEIASAVKTISDMNAMIASAAEEQSAVAEEINRSVVNITQISDETAAGARQTTSTAESLAGLAAQLRSLAHQFKVG